MDASFTRVKPNVGFLPKAIIVFLFLAIGFQSAQAQTDSLDRLKTVMDKNVFLKKFQAYQVSKNLSGLPDVADHNNYPLPQKVLSWQKELQLNDRQQAAIRIIDKELQRKVNEMNNFLITNERTIDSLFRYKKINNGLLIFYTNRYGLYQGELRNALLQACLKTEVQLTTTQLKKYDSLQQY
jgi:hypothetical protein